MPVYPGRFTPMPGGLQSWCWRRLFQGSFGPSDGRCKKKKSAERLVLNHIIVVEALQQAAVMQEIEEQASVSCDSKRRAVAAWDFMRVVIPVVV